MAQQTAKKLTQKAKSKLSQQKGTQGGGSKEPTLHEQVLATIKKMQAKDPGLKALMSKAHGYAVFPAVGKAALVVGGAYGRGEVYEKGKMIGHATIGQLTIGVQIGGDTFDELIVFESEEPLKRFKESRTKFAANASAVLVKAGAAASSNFEKGATVFVHSDGGMLLELALGGQKFNFKPGKIGDEEKDSGKDKDKDKGKAKGSQRGSSQANEAEADEDSDDEQGEAAGDEDEVGSTLGTATKAFKMVRNHPILAAMVGAGVAFYAMSRLMSNSSGSDQDEEENSEDDDDDQAQGSYDDEQDEGEEDEDRDEEEEDDDRGDESDEDDDESDEEDEDADEDEEEDEEDADEEEEESSRPSRSRR